MSLPAIVTLVGVGLIVLALAVYLLTVLALLRRTLSTLGTVNVGLRAIADRVDPLEVILTDINDDLTGVRDALVAAVPERGEAA